MANEIPYLSLVIMNTGKPAATDSTLYPETCLNEDIYKISAAISGGNNAVHLTNELVAITFGETREVKVYIANEQKSNPKSILTVQVTSVSNPSVTVSRTKKW